MDGALRRNAWIALEQSRGVDDFRLLFAGLREDLVILAEVSGAGSPEAYFAEQACMALAALESLHAAALSDPE